MVFPISNLYAGAITSGEEVKINTTGGGIKVHSDNGNSFQLGGIIQYDFDSYDGIYNSDTNNSTDLGNSATESEWRRSRITTKGSRGDNWSYDLTVNINDDSQSANIHSASVRYKGFQNTELIVGRLKVPFSLEELTSDKHIPTIERTAVYELGGFLRGQPDFQLAIHKNWDSFSGQFQFVDEKNEDDDGNDSFSIAGRLANQFFIGNQDKKNHYFHLGAAYASRDFGSEGKEINFRSGFGVQTIDVNSRPSAGVIRAKNAQQYGLETAYVNGPFSIQGEYLKIDYNGESDSPIGSNGIVDGYYIGTTYSITGESRGYSRKTNIFNAIKPNNNFGAWEIVAKYEEGKVDIDKHNMKPNYDVMTLGVNWYPNTNLRFSLNYLSTNLNNFLINGIQPGSGSDGEAVSFRTQYVF